MRTVADGPRTSIGGIGRAAGVGPILPGLGLSVLVVVVFACGELGPRLCTASVEPAIEIEVRDAVSGEPIAGQVRGLIRDGSYEDSLRISTMDGQGRALSLRAGDERPGVYSVLLRSGTHEAWDTAGVRVERGECHVRTALLRAELSPAR